MQCLVYACQIEPALPEEEAASLAKLLLGMAGGLQGLLPPRFGFCLTQPTCHDAMWPACYPMQVALCCGMLCTHAHPSCWFCLPTQDFLGRPCFVVIMHSLCQLC